jgi:hypothetical protein
MLNYQPLKKELGENCFIISMLYGECRLSTIESSHFEAWNAHCFLALLSSMKNKTETASQEV